MTVEIAQEAAELLQRLKVARIQLENFKSLNVTSEVGFINFRIGENIEIDNSLLVTVIKSAAMEYLSEKITILENRLTILT